MALDVVVPEVGEVGMEVTFVTWFVQEGDLVTSGAPLFQVDTQKSLLDVEAVATGRLANVLVHDGDIVEPRQVIATLLEGDEQPETAPGPATPPPIVVDPEPADDAGVEPRPPSSPARHGAASPRARRAAADLGVDLGGISGTGPDGLITESDVQAATAGPTRVSSARDRVRRAVADLTVRSWTSVPHFYVRTDIDLTRALDVAKPTPLIVWAFAQALLERPELNLSVAADGVALARSTVDLGLLVDSPDGLLLPVIRGVEHLTLEQTSDAIAEAASRARTGRLLPEDFGARSATVSNLGMFAVDQFAGIVATPDALLLSVGRATVRPAWDGTAFVPRSVASLTLSADHRVVDGADAGRLMSALSEVIERLG